MLPVTPLPDLGTSCSPAFLVELILRCWTPEEWALLLQCVPHSSAFLPDLEDVTAYHSTFISSAPSLLVFPDLQPLAHLFVRVLLVIASVEEPVSPEGWHLLIRRS